MPIAFPPPHVTEPWPRLGFVSPLNVSGQEIKRQSPWLGDETAGGEKVLSFLLLGAHPAAWLLRGITRSGGSIFFWDHPPACNPQRPQVASGGITSIRSQSKGKQPCNAIRGARLPSMGPGHPCKMPSLQEFESEIPGKLFPASPPPLVLRHSRAE